VLRDEVVISRSELNIFRELMPRLMVGRCRGAAAVVAAVLCLLVLVPCQAESVKRWDFDGSGDREGWTVSDGALGVVMGGSLWVALNPKERDPAAIATTAYQAFGEDFNSRSSVEADTGVEVMSPRGVDVSTPEVQQVQVRMRVLNLSPATDLFLRWRTKQQTEGWGTREKFSLIPAQSRRCALSSDLKRWQEVTCYVDKQWHGVIDQIAIYIPQAIRGDIWLDSVEIVVGPAEPARVRPDVASDAVVPKVALPGISQAGFAEAFKVLDRCLIVDVPLEGFTHPFMSAGGYYNPRWFPLDTSLTLSGAKWVNQRFAEGVMRGFHDVQTENPDGRFDISGSSAVRGQVADTSQVPAFFEVAYDVARRTNDLQLRGEIYQTMQRYLDWWLSPVKRDSRTGLISGVFEEAFGEPELPRYGMRLQSVAPVALNVAVAVGAARTADLAAELGKEGDSKKYRQVFDELSRAINGILWDEQDGVYYSYDLREHHARKHLMVSTFDPLRLGMAPPTRRDRLLKRLLDPDQFNWGKRPLTGWAMTDPGYEEWKGENASRAWFGDIWTLSNMQVVTGLEESGHPDLAAELNWATIKAFHMHYREFLLPSSGEGRGGEDNGLSASQYVAAIVEHLFGVDFDRAHKWLRIEPHVPQALYGQTIVLESLILPTEGDTRLSLRIKQSALGSAEVGVDITGPLPLGSLEIALPGSARKVVAPTQHSMTAVFP
jgi:hypothetical protein